MGLFDPDFFTSAQARWNWLRTEAPRSLFDLPAAQLLPFLRSEGFQIGDDTFQLIYNQVKSERLFESQFTTLGDTDLIPASWHNDQHGLFLSDNFLYRFEVVVQDNKTGEIISLGTNIRSSEQEIFGEIRDRAFDRLSEVAKDSDLSIITFGMTDALARQGVFIE